MKLKKNATIVKYHLKELLMMEWIIVEVDNERWKKWEDQLIAYEKKWEDNEMVVCMTIGWLIDVLPLLIWDDK